MFTYNFQHVDEHNILNLYHNVVITRIAIILPTNILHPTNPNSIWCLKLETEWGGTITRLEWLPHRPGSEELPTGNSKNSSGATLPDSIFAAIWAMWHDQGFGVPVLLMSRHVCAGPSEACRYETACGCCMCGSDARPRSNRVVLPQLPYYKIRTIIINIYTHRDLHI